MPSCYNHLGNEISCASSTCIGEDCSNASNDYVYGDTFDPSHDLFGTEGLWDMDEQEFQSWFMDYMPWGEEASGFTTPGQETPTFEDNEGALYLASLFGGYDHMREFLLVSQQNNQEFQANQLFNIWESNSEDLIEERKLREEAIQDKTKTIWDLEENYKDRIEGWKAKGEFQELVGAEAQIGEEKKKGGIRGKRATTAYEDEVSNAMNKFVLSKQIDEEALDTKVEMTDSKLAYGLELADLRFENDRTEKVARITADTQQGRISVQDKINQLRDEYEGGVYDTLATLGATGAFFETAYENEAVNMQCSHWTDQGDCLYWNMGGLLGAEDMDSDEPGYWSPCVADCADGCTQFVACGGQPPGIYQTGANCCPGANNEIEPGDCVAAYTISGECANCCAECTGSYGCPGASDGSDCFAKGSIVTTKEGKVNVEDLKVGDEILTLDKNGNLMYTKVWILAHMDNETELDYFVIETDDGNTLKISSHHALFKHTDKLVPVIAKNLKVGDTLSNGKIKTINREVIKGKYTVFTDEGTMIVDGVHCSCYVQASHYSNHWGIKYFFKPFIKLTGKVHKTDKNGRNVVLRWLKINTHNQFIDSWLGKKWEKILRKFTVKGVVS